MRQAKRAFRIALTGGIASGKTCAVDFFKQNGFEVFSADKIGHELLNHPVIIQEIVSYFGKEILLKGRIDREKLGNIVFSSPEKLAILNNILHPGIKKKIAELMETYTYEYLIMEIPLLFETQSEVAFDLTINIYTNRENQLLRLQKRNGITREQAEEKIYSQMSTQKKSQKADINIENSDKLSKLEQNIEEIIQKLPDFPFKDVKKL